MLFRMKMFLSSNTSFEAMTYTEAVDRLEKADRKFEFPVHWGGDNSATYPSMAETLRGPLGKKIMYGGIALGALNVGKLDRAFVFEVIAQHFSSALRHVLENLLF